MNLLKSLRLSKVTLGHEMLFFAGLVGLASGFAAIGFYWLLDYSTHAFLIARPQGVSVLSGTAIVLFPALGGLLCGLLLFYFAPDASGGVPEVIDAFHNREGVIRKRVWVMKSIASSLCVGSGGSAGREGPVVQIGASVGSTLARIFMIPQSRARLLTACGAAGGISAVFNAPIAGVFFAAEIVMGEFEMSDMTLLFTSSAMACAISRTFLKNNAAFDVPTYELHSGWELGLQILLGVLCAVVGKAFIASLHKSEMTFARLKIHPVLKPALGGLLVGIIGLLVPEVFGTSSEVLENIFNSPAIPVWLLTWMAAKIIATSLTLGSGGSGGDLMPSLFIGGALGATLGSFVHSAFPALTMAPGAYGLIGAAALFSAIAQAPMTSIILGFEMGNNYELILPLMVACSISAVISRHIHEGSIYTIKLKERGIDIAQFRHVSARRVTAVLLIVIGSSFISRPLLSAEVETNAIVTSNAPAWADAARFEKVTAKIQRALEWDIRRVHVFWYTDQAVFEKSHGYGPSVLAYSSHKDNSVHIGPKVTAGNFDGVFGHELVHVIIFQKYKDAIPKWLEEGLANYVAGFDTVDYSWLKTRVAQEGDVRALIHPFKGVAQLGGPEHARYHYMASKALVEMIVANCSLNDLLQLSVGKKLETYLDTFCGIPDVNSSFKAWVESKGRAIKP
ncbi:MAG: chloride channel protein [Oligoflexia bacterium]|nr:chloride channel protein [Oligoflexia bacterium]